MRKPRALPWADIGPPLLGLKKELFEGRTLRKKNSSAEELSKEKTFLKKTLLKKTLLK